MTFTPCEIARCAVAPKAFPSIGATTRTLAPFVISCSACDCCVSGLFCAFRTSTVTFGMSFFIAFTNVGWSKPSQRGVTFSGSRNATRGEAAAPVGRALPVVAPPAAASTAIVATPAANHARRRGFVRNPSLTVTSSFSASVRKRILRLPDSRMEPLRLEPTRVYRFYRGGAQLARFRGGEAEDGSFPEDWVCSVTGATNAGRQQADEGLTRLEDGRLLREAVAQEPEAWLGPAHVERFGVTTGLLVKLLDPAERILVHTHPDRAFAASHLGSEFGKTEAWIVLATREGAGEAFVGLREAVEPAEYREWIERQDVERLLGSLNHVPLRAGDVVYVPAGVPHAIGGGMLIAELQEPTDFSIVCEWEGYPVRPEDAHLGLGWDTALDALDLAAHEPVRELPETAAAFFWADDRIEAAGRFAALIVLEGEGEIAGIAVQRGDVLAVPATVPELEASGAIAVLRCLAPDATLA